MTFGKVTGLLSFLISLSENGIIMSRVGFESVTGMCDCSVDVIAITTKANAGRMEKRERKGT